MAEPTPTATDGQALGPRGVETRRRILEAMARLIEQHGVRGVKQSDVAREVGFSPPAFYQYFHDMDEAMLALCEYVSEQVPDYRSMAGETWDQVGEAGSREFIERFFEYWDEHRVVLHTREAMLDAGDARYRKIRDETFQPITRALMAKIEAAQQAGRIDPELSPRALAATLIVMIDRLGMLSPSVIEPWGDKASDVIAAVAFVFDRVLGTAE